MGIHHFFNNFKILKVSKPLVFFFQSSLEINYPFALKCSFKTLLKQKKKNISFCSAHCTLVNYQLTQSDCNICISVLVDRDLSISRNVSFLNYPEFGFGEIMFYAMEIIFKVEKSTSDIQVFQQRLSHTSLLKRTRQCQQVLWVAIVRVALD